MLEALEVSQSHASSVEIGCAVLWSVAAPSWVSRQAGADATDFGGDCNEGAALLTSTLGKLEQSGNTDGISSA